MHNQHYFVVVVCWPCIVVDGDTRGKVKKVESISVGPTGNEGPEVTHAMFTFDGSCGSIKAPLASSF